VELTGKKLTLFPSSSPPALACKHPRETMKHLKSSLHDLRQVFDRSVSVRYIAAPFVSFDAQRHAPDVWAFMEAKDFDIVGVRQNGTVVGYVHRADLREGTLEQYVKPFDAQLLLDDWSPMLTVLQLLARFPQVFVVVMGEVSGIIMKGDLQKAPVRMWLFGVLSLLEMQFLRLIRTAYPGDTWKGLISKKRLTTAEKLLQERQQRNEAIDLADCLQFADKRTIVLKSDSLRHALRFPSKRKGEGLLKALEHLRDELAHAQDIITGRWPQLVEFAQAAEQLLATCEALEPETAG
jgi:predicted transcriptional regulator